MFFFQVARWVLAYHTECAESVDLMNLKNVRVPLRGVVLLIVMGSWNEALRDVPVWVGRSSYRNLMRWNDQFEDKVFIKVKVNAITVCLDLESWYGPFCTLTMKQILEGVHLFFKWRQF